MKRSCNKLVLKFSMAILLTLSATNFAIASGQTRESTKRRLIARVLSVDYEKRTMLVREFDGQKTTLSIPKDREISLSQDWPTMGRSHLVDLEATTPGLVIDVYVLTMTKVEETANAASGR
jgi:hypothetical protein